MLTIKNYIKIVNHAITAEWYVEDISELDDWNPLSLEREPYYCIKIRNRINGYFEEVNLYRQCGTHGHWYEISCTSRGKTHTQYINIQELKDIKVLLRYIKKVGID